MLSYLAFSLTLAAVYCLLALGLTVIWGYTGMVNLGIVGFFAVGAYASAIATTQLHWPILAGWVLGTVAAGAAGAVLTHATRGLRGDYREIRGGSGCQLSVSNNRLIRSDAEIPARQSRSRGHQR